MTVLAEGTARVSVDYHQFCVIDEGELDPYPADVLCHLVGAFTTSGLLISTGIGGGAVDVTWASHDVEPTTDLDAWEDVAQVVANCPSGSWDLVGWGNESRDATALASNGPGRYVVRVSARGRDAVWDDTLDPSTEAIHLDVWPAADDDADLVLKATSEVASAG
ncbi:hypothetical protein ACT17Q_02055 [Cellulomonas sp. CW35]|uniref:Uncharacterized protein n=1 Tax=Cellulomonas uda TaxID=1714 RepID=A0A4Y3KEJ2_CELUD|nr:MULTISPECIES: hypothetical protein [Cellulomonas]ASR55626.1 hypothetical protein CBP52_11590 [Cellulomonas sp. PSBB021]NII66722.1 hypothetical protein [Cellulomonas uda]GEA82437.1 hypothetical protein CUD01_28810 [Cellulomonas uda]